MSIQEVITGIIVPIVAGFVGGLAGGTVIVNKKIQKQKNINNSEGIQIGEIKYETKK